MWTTIYLIGYIISYIIIKIYIREKEDDTWKDVILTLTMSILSWIFVIIYLLYAIIKYCKPPK